MLSGAAQQEPLHVSAGSDGSAQITLGSGERTTIRKELGQVGISEIQTAPDGQAAGWLVEYSVDGLSDPVPGMLVVWHARKIRRFPTGQAFYSWAFYAQGKQVAYHVGPLHGERESHCELHDVDSGRRIAAWDGDLESTSGSRPAWTHPLSH
jgi:hypothetical protein